MTSLRILLFLAAALALAAAPVSAQTCAGEPFEANTTNWGGINEFGCPTSGNTGSPFCGITYRFYSSEATSNGNVNAGVDGNPVFRNNAYRSDVDNSSNYFGASHPCGPTGPAMYNLWDAQQAGGSGDHRGYYAAQTQVIEAAEQGNPLGTCGGTRFISCFTAADADFVLTATSTPQGSLGALGGLAAIPVPIVSSGTGSSATLSWPDATNVYVANNNINDPSGIPDPENAPDPILGIDLYYLPSSGLLDSRTITDGDLDGSAVFLRFVAKGTTSTTVTCADVGLDPVTNPGTWLPAARVKYRDNAATTPMETTFWSANGPVIRCADDALFVEVVNFQARYGGRARGRTSTLISWETVAEAGLDGFLLWRGSSLEGPWTQVGDLIPPAGVGGEGASYGQTDVFRRRGDHREVFYRLEVLEADSARRSVGPIRLEMPRGTTRRTREMTRTR